VELERERAPFQLGAVALGGLEVAEVLAETGGGVSGQDEPR
jgi:hypothetical protein